MAKQYTAARMGPVPLILRQLMDAASGLSRLRGSGEQSCCECPRASFVWAHTFVSLRVLSLGVESLGRAETLHLTFLGNFC